MITPPDEDWRAFLERTDRAYRRRRLYPALFLLACATIMAASTAVIIRAI